MMHPTRAGMGLVRLSDSDFVPQNPEDDLRGKDVYDPEGQRIGGVKDLYIDYREREMRFLQVSAGGFLGMGEKPHPATTSRLRQTGAVPKGPLAYTIELEASEWPISERRELQKTGEHVGASLVSLLADG